MTDAKLLQTTPKTDNTPEDYQSYGSEPEPNRAHIPPKNADNHEAPPSSQTTENQNDTEDKLSPLLAEKPGDTKAKQSYQKKKKRSDLKAKQPPQKKRSETEDKPSPQKKQADSEDKPSPQKKQSDNEEKQSPQKKRSDNEEKQSPQKKQSETEEKPSSRTSKKPSDTEDKPSSQKKKKQSETEDKPSPQTTEKQGEEPPKQSADLAQMHPALNKYKNLQTIGIGGQGTMLRAISPNGQPVAIKVFDIQTTDSFKSIELFEREIDTLKSIDVHGVPKFIEDIRSDKYIYLVEEYINAPSLEKIMKNGKRYSFEQILTILKNAAQILDELTSLIPPIIHRDIKPANLLVDDDLNVTLVDFGAVAAKVQLSFAMTFAGTAGYLAPEQLYGKATPASDIFSLGVTIAHLITNKEPCDMDMDDMRLKIEKYIPPTIPFWFVGFLQLMIEPNTSIRFQNGKQVIEYLNNINNYTQDNPAHFDLQQLQSNYPIAAPKPPQDPDLPSDPNDLTGYQLKLGKTYRSFKANMKDYRFWGLFLPVICILLSLPVFSVGSIIMESPVTSLITTWLPGILPPLLLLSAFATNHTPSPLEFRSDKFVTTKVAKALNELYMREILMHTLPKDAALYKDKRFIELSQKFFSPEKFLNDELLPLNEKENRRLDLYLNDAKVLYPCLRYRPIRNFNVSSLVKTILCPTLFYAFSLVVLLFSTLPLWWNFFLLISLTVFAIRNILGITRCTFYHRTRYNDPRHLDAYKLYTRRFLEECRKQARNTKQ